VGRLAGGIAHDFNNLLTIILGYTGLLSLEIARSSKDPKQLRNLDEIHKAAENAASLTSQLLSFSRKQVLRTRVIDLNPVMANLEGMLRRLIGEDVDLQLILDSTLGRVRVDRSQFEQALMNLAVNARDAMPYGGMLTIEARNVEISRRYAALSSMKAGPHVLVSVTDTGTGMDDETRSRVFEPFFTTKEAGRGTGLGLSMVYGFVKQSGGSVAVYSEPGHGSCFKIYLPRTQAAAEAEAEREIVPKRRGSGLILVVEDEIGIRDLIREILVAAGYEVYTAANAREALEFAEIYEGEIHLLLSDVVLPGLSGPEMAEQLKAARPDLKVLFASGYSDHALLRRGALSRGAAFIGKPFDTDTLLARVADLVMAAPKSETGSPS
jgi:CheY-like chemotaxis protein